MNSQIAIIVLCYLVFIMFLLFYIVNSKKRNKQKMEMLNNLKKGDKIITIGGIFGEIDKVLENEVIIKVSDSSKIKILKRAVASLEK